MREDSTAYCFRISSNMVTIYVIVGSKIRSTPAKLVGKVAEVKTEYGVREFGTFYLNYEDAERALKKRKGAKWQQS